MKAPFFMCFENLYESSQRCELLLVAGGMCHWHLRRDGQITIREIISQRPGVGTEMLKQLRQVSGATSILAKCPFDLASNGWYASKGFVLESIEYAKSGRAINVWRMKLS